MPRHVDNCHALISLTGSSGSQPADRCIDTRIHPAAPLLVVSGHSQPTQQLLQSALIGNVDSTDSKQRLTTNNSDTQSASSQPTTLLSVVSGDSQPADRRHAMCAYCVIILVLTASNHSQQVMNPLVRPRHRGMDFANCQQPLTINSKTGRIAHRNIADVN